MVQIANRNAAVATIITILAIAITVEDRAKEEVVKTIAEVARSKAVMEEAGAAVATFKVEMAGAQMDEVKANATMVNAVAA